MKLRPLILFAAMSAVVACSALSIADQTAQLSKITVPDAVGRSQRMGRSPANRVMHVTVSMPFGDPVGMQKFADSVSDPNNANYRNFITPEEVGRRFGISDTKVKAIHDYLVSKGFKITMVSDNRLAIMADCTVAQAEAAFATRIEDFKALDIREKDSGRPSYYSYVVTPSVPASIAPDILAISGLENFTRPKKRNTLSPTQTRKLYNLAPVYVNFKGQGRTVAISSFDGFRLSNLPTFYSTFGLPTPPGGIGSNVTVVAINGGSGGGTPQGEADLDIQMVLGQAPLCKFIIYDGTDLVSCLAREAQDNLADVISESYGWNPNLTDTNAAHNLHVSMSAQGITYTLASGDFGTDFIGFDYANYDPEVLIVGGTEATTDHAGTRGSEIGWSGSGGGWSTVPAAFNVLPIWQKGNGVPTNVNFRLNPDIALHAFSQQGAYTVIFNGSPAGISGTSASSPVFAGALAVVQQREISLGALPPNGAGKRRAGRIQDLIYLQNGKPTIWFDITTGSNGNLPNGQTSNAKPGWDYVTGWGAPNFNNFTFTKGVKLPQNLNFLGVNEGSAVIGTSFFNVVNLDGTYFSIRPNTIASLGQAASASFSTTLPTTVSRSQLIQMDFTVSAKFATNATGQLYLFNYLTGKWDIAKSYQLTSGVTTIGFTLKGSFTTYVSGAGECRFLVRGLYPTFAGSTGATFDLDRVALTSTYAP